VIDLNPEKNTFKITELWAFVSSDEGGEGIVGKQMGPWMMPLIAADKARFDQLMPLAKELQKTLTKKVKVLRFKLVEEEDLPE